MESNTFEIPCYIVGMTSVKRGKEWQYILPEYEPEIEEQELATKRRFLEPFFTNLDKDVYAITGNLPPILAAVLVARQSRAMTRDARELLWEEFTQIDELGLLAIREVLGSGFDVDDFLASEKAAKKIKNIIDGFGDDSVREQASAYVMFQNMSVFATTFGVVHPLLTRIEASTRYIDWGTKAKGKYLYKELDFGDDEAAKVIYENAMEVCFGTYGQLWQSVWDYVVSQNPREEGVAEFSYFTAVRGKVCDNLRGLLPLGALTNFGLHGDFRSLSEMVMNLRAAENEEMRQMGDRMYEELAKVNPEFIAVSDNEHGKAWTKHRQATRERLASEPALMRLLPAEKTGSGVEVESSALDFMYQIGLAYLSSHSPSADKDSVAEEAFRMEQSGEMAKLLSEIGRLRKNRRHELPEFLREITVNIKFRDVSFGTLKDLFRHRRILRRSQPDLSGQRGNHIPKDIRAIGGEVLERYQAAQNYAAEAVDWMRKRGNEEAANYLLLHGMFTSFDIKCDLVEAYWISELRSIASGFEEYRWAAQQVWKELLLDLPELELLGSFTNMTESYPLGRIKEAVRADLAQRS